MQFDGFDDGLWDEFRWEAHLEEVERKSDQLRKFISSDSKGNTPRWLTLLNESLSEDDAFDAYVEEELLLDEAYFPEEDDDWEDEDDFDEDDFLFGYEDEFYDDEDDFDEGEEWKSLSNDYALSNYGSLDNLEIYNNSKEYAIAVLRWVEKVPNKFQSKPLQEYVSETLKIGAKLAGGYSFGFEPDYIGANIAYTKKALKYANLSLQLLQSLKKSPYFDSQTYAGFHAYIFELRNDIGVYVQELRDRFNLRLD